jgi:hypothetical protein
MTSDQMGGKKGTLTLLNVPLQERGSGGWEAGGRDPLFEGD